jgi:drug/metabolite transporter (DMT)-like permease
MFATWPIVGKIALRSLPSTVLVAFRTAGAALALVVLQGMIGPREKIRGADWPLLLLCGLLGVVLNQLLFVKGLSLTTVINATLLGTTIPVFTLLISIFLGRDRGTMRLALGMALAAGGVIYLIGPMGAEFSTGNRVGDLLIVANSISYGAYIAVSKDLVKRYGALTIITWIFIVSSAVTVPIGVANLSYSVLLHLPPVVWLSVLYIILIPTVGAYYLNAWALARVPPSTVAVYIYLQPLIAFALAPLLLGETWSWRTLLAAGLIFAGVAIVTSRSRSRAIREVSEHPEALGH